MKVNCIQAFSLLAIVLISMSVVPFSNAQVQTPAHDLSFLLLNHPDGDKTYELNLTIPQALYQYYTLKNHLTQSPSDLEKFVTPYTMKPIADRLWQIYNNTEDFTNGVLMLVHQIPYREIVPGKYPVETLVDGSGDCDLFVYIAASILEAGGVNTVLLYYKDKLHMEIGVDLGVAPRESRVQAFFVTSDNASYYIGECTGDKWRTGWRIGETPLEYQNVSAQVITLDSIEQSSIGQVSANLRELDPSTVNLQASSGLILSKSNFTLNGKISANVTNENVTLQANVNNRGWTTIGTTLSRSDGSFSYVWAPAEVGTIALQASWVGNRQYNGAISSQANVIVLPLYFVIIITICAVILAVLVIVVIQTKRSRGQKAPAI